MHDSDQAAVLGDAWHLSGGGSWQPTIFYNYDKLFITDWLLAALFWIMRQFDGNDVVLAGNLFASILLSGAVMTVQLVARFRWCGYFAFLTTLLAPTFLLHAPFMAPAFVSSALLLLLFAVIERSRGKRNRWHYFAIALLTFAAVGARADAALALPFLVWLNIPVGRRLWQVWRAPLIAAIGAGVLVAAIVSLGLRDPDVIYSGEPAFNAKAFAAYVVFGFGGALLVLGCTGVRLGTLVCRASAHPRFGWLVGVGALTLPFAFYTIQLFSIRYWAVGLTAFLMLICSRRGQILFEGRWARTMVTLGLLGAIGPLWVGMRLPSPQKWPRLVTHDATTLPSADGLIPMGAFLTYDFARRDPATGGARDHNHAIWLAAQSATFVPAADGAVPVLITPMYSISRLAVLLKSQQVRGYKLFEIPPVCYAETRSLIKFQRPLAVHQQASDPMAAYVANAHIEAVSPAFRGIAIQRVQKEDTLAEPHPVWHVFRSIFEGDDFWPREGSEVWNADGTLRVGLGRGATIAVLSPATFELVVTSRDSSTRIEQSAAVSAFPQWQVVILNGNATEVVTVKLSERTVRDGTYYSAETVLPDFMSQTRAERR